MSEVSPATEARLREAMERLLAGQATKCHGQLTKSNLAREAGVSRATMHRAQSLLLEWDRRTTGRAPKSEEVQKLEDRLAREMATTRRLRSEIRQLQGRLRAATAVMLEMQTVLNEQKASSVVSSIEKKRKS